MNRTTKLLSVAIGLSVMLQPQLMADTTTETPLLYGFMTVSDEWRDVEPASEKYGYYTFRADGSEAFTPASSISPDNAWAVSAGTKVGNSFIGYTVPAGSSYMRYPLNFYVIDASTYEPTFSATFKYENNDADKEQSDAYLIPADVAYDMINNVVYTVAWRYNSDQGSHLCTVDIATGKLTRLKPIERMPALTADPQGNLLGIGMDGNLYAITHEGDATVIAHTGYWPADLHQSASYDFKTGKIYWSAACFASLMDRNYNRNGIYAMMEVDPATAETKVLWEYPRQERFSSLSINNPHPLSPADVTDFTFVPESFEALKAKLEFTVPTQSATSAQLTGNVTVRCFIDNSVVETLTKKPGEKVSRTYSVTEGEHNAAVEIEYNGNTGNRIYQSSYFGKDIPAKIAKVRLEIDPDDFVKATVHWAAPKVGKKGAPYDASKIRYRVVRYPDEKVIKRSLADTTFTDNVDLTYSRVFYAIQPYNVDRPAELGDITTSNGAMRGTDIVIPYKESFDTPASINSFTILDVDQNGTPGQWGTPIWMYDETYYCAFYYGMPDTPADDWLVTPPLNLDPNKLYRLSYKWYGYYGYGNHFEVGIASTPTDEALTARIIQDVEKVSTSFDNPGIEESVLFAPHAGDRFIGFHHISTTMEHMSIDDIRVEEFGDSRIPETVSNLVGTRQNSEAAVLTFNAPANTAAGVKLEGKISIKILRNTSTEPVATLTDIEPGKEVVWTDTEAIKGKNDYTVYGVNSFGDGLKATVSVDLSDAVPVPVTNVLTRYINDRQIEITWNPVTSTTGDNGNPLDLDDIRYLVYKPISHEDGMEYRIIGRDLTGTRFIDSDPFLGRADGQQIVNYYVAPLNPAGEGIAELSTGVLIGKAYSLPFEETWFEQTTNTTPWSNIISNGASWYMRHKGYDPMTDGQDGFGVLTCENNFGYTEGLGAMMSPRIDLTTMANPELTFYYYRDPVYDSSIQLRVALLAEGATSYQYLGTLYQPKHTQAGWEKVTIDLTPYANLNRVSVVLFATIKEGNLVHVDNLSIKGKSNTNIVRGAFITGEDMLRERMAYRYVGTVYNHGEAAATNVKATLSAGNEVVGTATIESIPAGGSAEAEFEFTPSDKHVGTTILSLTTDGDSYAATKEVTVNEFNPAAVHNLAAAPREDKITLYWSVPGITTKAQTAIEDFESFDSFAIDSVGAWTMLDLDGQLPFKFSNGQGGTLEWPNNDKPQAFMVFNPLMLPSAPQPHSGYQCLVSWGSPTGDNNDWLISPELPGQKQIISFYARSFAGGRENFHVLISTTDNKPESFVSLTGMNPVTAPASWELYHYLLPEGTKYFAINYVGSRQDGLMIDDIMFHGYHNPVTPSGYNIYRDGRKLNDNRLFDRVYVDTDVVLGEQHTYIVRALYNGHESADSNPVTVAATAIDGVEVSPEAAITVEGLIGSIRLTGVEGMPVEIFRTDGALLAAIPSAAANELTIDAPAGIYMVRTGSRTFKVAVR